MKKQYSRLFQSFKLKDLKYKKCQKTGHCKTQKRKLGKQNRNFIQDKVNLIKQRKKSLNNLLSNKYQKIWNQRKIATTNVNFVQLLQDVKE